MTDARNRDTIQRVRRVLLILSAVLLAWAALVLATGGIEWRIAGVLLRSRDPGRALLALVVLLLLQALLFRRAFGDDLDRAAALARRGAPWLAAAAALVLATHALRHGSYTAAGSDAYGYVSQAYGWASGSLPRPYDLALRLPIPSGDLIQVPLAHRLGPRAHTMLPTYAPGLPLLMAVAIRIAGAIGPYLIVPLCAALYVWCTFLLGRRALGPVTGLVSATLVATSPIVLGQSESPMSDVPAGALWTAAAVASLGDSRGRAALGGLCAALGLLVRPNLVLLVLVPFGQIVLAARGRERFIRGLLFCLPVLAAVAAIAALNATWFGSPFTSGYGRTADYFSLSSVWPNLRHYAAWLWQSQSPWILIAAGSLTVPVRSGAGQPAIRLSWVLLAVTLLSYIAFLPYESWWFLRFLLPGLGAFFVLVAAGVTAVARRVPSPWGRVIAFAIVLLMLQHAASFALRVTVLGSSHNSDHRYADVGDFVARTLPENAVVLAMQHSGTIRFYGGRATLRYDFIDRDWGARAPAEIEALGLHPYLVIEDWEEPNVQKQFGLPADRELPWPQVARLRASGGVTVYDLATIRPTLTPVALEPDSAPLYSAPKTIVLEPR